MKYRIKTIEENGKYIGYVLNNDEVIFTSTPQETSTLASIQVTKFINKQTNKPLNSMQTSQSVTQTTAHASPATSSVAPVVAPAPRRCCGRG